MTYDAYILCTSPRSGSTLLCKLLAASGVAGAPRSYFHKPSLAAWIEYFDLPPQGDRSPRDTLVDIVSAARAQGRAKTTLFGLRLQRGSAPFFFDQLALLHPKAPTDKARFEAAFGRTCFVHLTREDKLDQAISYVKAEQSGLWHQAPDGTEIERLSPPAEPVYDADRLQTQINRFTQFDADWQAWFSAQSITPCRITYSDLAADPQSTLRTLLKTLGQDPIAADAVQPAVAKLADTINQSWAARFRADRGPQGPQNP